MIDDAVLEDVLGIPRRQMPRTRPSFSAHERTCPVQDTFLEGAASLELHTERPRVDENADKISSSSPRAGDNAHSLDTITSRHEDQDPSVSCLAPNAYKVAGGIT